MPVSSNKRLSFVNFPIPFDHPYTIPTLIATVGASAFLYYSLQASHKADLKEAIRQQVVHKRKHLKRKQEKFASLKIEHQYVNPFTEWKQPNISFVDSILYWLGINNNNQIPKIEQDLIDTLPMTKPDFNHNNTSLTWLGQSTCLITIDGLKILTDPVFEHTKRLRPPPCSLQDIGNIDIVLVSHQHFDHLDEKAVEHIGDSATWYIPLGLRDWFIKKGIDNVIELDWWQEMHHKGHADIVIASVPSMHTSPKEESLWCSFVIKSQSDRIFFCSVQLYSGDTGYVPELFQSIRDIYSPFTMAALPIGTFEPQAMLKSLHMTPKEAIQAHVDLGSPRISIGIHWGTFMKSNEPYLSPIQQLFDLYGKVEGNDASRFITTSFGKTIFA
ncbi:N-acyl-phosphatidylethanolamine-hydrolyzing phospholipase D [Mucor ambiguus]|uniref:N-acyl-phosphatidylethanolamine-hydrolyzing phospholipase D n=1 Tax=Mucor ambiguus TaxID=91626 RepID=A0A0C9MFL8_9FUNG|nr:N-acyl-phosphatidylethanolamine-hydrolyzing phospholipase D [Mucor ambiguus]